MKNGIYIYGIIQTPDPQQFGKIGIGDQPSDVCTAEVKDIAAVISSGPLMAYDSLTKDKTIKALVTHQFVLESVMKSFTVLPVKFGTMVETEDEVRAFLETGYPLLCQTLNDMEGKMELDLVASWDLPQVLATISRNNREIQKQQQAVARKGTSVVVEERIALGKLIDQALKNRRASHQQLIMQVLEKNVLDVRSHDLANDEMVFNAAFLLERTQEASFNELVEALDQKLENAVNFRLVGPLPAYSFSTLLLTKIDSHKLDEAKHVLGIHGEVTSKAVRDAYHQLAQKYHPDKSSDANAMDFSHLNAAYRTLQSFCEHGSMQVEVYQWEKASQ